MPPSTDLNQAAPGKALLAPLFADYPAWFAVTAAAVVTAVVAYLIAELVARAASVGMRGMLGSADEHARATVARAGRLIRIVVFVLLALVLIFPALELVGLSTSVGLHPEALGSWLLESGLRIGVVILVAFLIMRIVSTVTTRFEREMERSEGIETLERLRRARTLGTLIRSTLGTLVSVIALLMILRELNLDITPILTGAGIVGLAVGFGAQSLVKDVISGFFLILENQVRVGDVAAINGTAGAVEAISLRTIVLRDGSGTVHVFPNGSITTLSNRSKDFSFYEIDLGLPYDEHLDRVVPLLKEIGEELRADPRFAPSILAPLEVFGVDSFGETQITVKLRIKTLPLRQWDVGRELRGRLVRRFRDEGIQLSKPPVMLLHVAHADAAGAPQAAVVTTAPSATQTPTSPTP
jgi:small-conductance mechanosensitive channel